MLSSEALKQISEAKSLIELNVLSSVLKAGGEDPAEVNTAITKRRKELVAGGTSFTSPFKGVTIPQLRRTSSTYAHLMFESKLGPSNANILIKSDGSVII